MDAAKLDLLIRGISALSALTLDVAEKLGVTEVDVPSVAELKKVRQELEELPDLHPARS